MKTCINTFYMVLAYLRYKLKAKRIMPCEAAEPFVKGLLNQVFYATNAACDYSKVEKLINALKQDSREVEFIEMGGGSRSFAHSDTRVVADILRASAVKQKYGRLLSLLVAYYKPINVLEIGTSIGVSTLYLALPTRTIVYTLEGNKAVSEIAQEMARKLQLANVDFSVGNFDTLLPKVIQTLDEPALVFVDGNHTYEATINYYHQIVAKLKRCIIVFDDINWSKGMQQAWKEIVAAEDFTVNIFQFGIVVKGENIRPQNIWLRY